MICSLALLTILQFFWIQGSYEKAFHGLRRESGMIFRTTVMALRDSTFLQNIEIIPADSMPPTADEMNLRKSINNIFAIRTERMKHVTRNDSGQLEIYTTFAGNDSSVNHEMLRPLAGRIRAVAGKPGNGRKRFIIRMAPDTLDIDTLRFQFREALAKAGINVPFRIRHTVIAPPDGDDHRGPFPFAKEFEFAHEAERRSDRAMYGDSLTLEPVHINPMIRYSTSLANVRGIILAQITPQIFFSVFLSLLTAITFFVMYRNLRSQQRLMDAKNDFISNVTHELKTPVATVSVALEALRNFHAMDNPKLTQEYLDIAQHELNRLSLMTDKILKTSIFETNGVDYRAETIDLNATTQQIIASMKMVFEKRGATVRYTTDGTNFSLRGGTIHLTNVVYNLIDNALKYSPGHPVITVSLQNSDDSVRLSVKDQGLGIAPEYHKKIFEKFFRVPTGDVHNAKGYGLGLNYVASVIRSHDGTIIVESEPGKGSCFTITLPRQGAAAHE